MMTRLILAAVLAALGLPAAAQDADFEAAMEVQRCVWACMSNEGGADSLTYGPCVERNCNGPVEGAQSEPAPALQAASSGTWVYGVHPVLGLSAHVQTAEGALGIACADGPVRPAALRATNDLFRDRGLTFVFDISPGWSSTEIARGAGAYAEARSTTCGHQLWHFSGSDRLFAIDGLTVPGASGLVIAVGGSQYRAESGSAAAGIPGARAITLRGSSAAIAALTAACPALADAGCD